LVGPHRGALLDKIGDQLPAIGITAASLTLVFLGFVLASWESYDTTAKAAVRRKYRIRGKVALAGIIASLLSVLFGFIAVGTEHACKWVDVMGVACLGVWGVLTAIQATIALRDIK
jgi:hypothetical protein